jgi:hypothetical protein
MRRPWEFSWALPVRELSLYRTAHHRITVSFAAGAPISYGMALSTSVAESEPPGNVALGPQHSRITCGLESKGETRNSLFLAIFPKLQRPLNVCNLFGY